MHNDGLMLIWCYVTYIATLRNSGALYDAIGNYDSGFYFSGLMIFISGIMLFALPLMERNRDKNRSVSESQDSKEVGDRFKVVAVALNYMTYSCIESFQMRFRKQNLIFALANECRVDLSKNLDTNTEVPAQPWDSQIPGTFPIAIIGTRGGRRDDT